MKSGKGRSCINPAKGHEVPVHAAVFFWKMKQVHLPKNGCMPALKIFVGAFELLAEVAAKGPKIGDCYPNIGAGTAEIILLLKAGRAEDVLFNVIQEYIFDVQSIYF